VPVANSGLGFYPGSTGPLTPWLRWSEVGPVLFTNLLDPLEARDLEGRELDGTPGAEDYPTSTAAHDRALGPTQRGITDVVTKRAKGRYKP
jgi:hypothetical protein